MNCNDLKRDPGNGKVKNAYFPEQMPDAAAIPRLTRTEQADGTACYFSGNTCIRAREVVEAGKVQLEPIAGDQVACGEWVDLSLDCVYSYCILLAQYLNKEVGA